jgi:hypothetical protein
VNGKPDVRPDAPAAGRRPALAAAAGVVRWVAMAASTSVIALALVQPLATRVTFAALHLACMRVISAIVPQHLAVLRLSTSSNVVGRRHPSFQRRRRRPLRERPSPSAS